MPQSQLKRLRVSLRERGITGPQSSKNKKKRGGNDRASKEKLIARSAALESIRETFNPFEIKQQSRPDKYVFANAPKNSAAAVSRPGVSRGLGEENRRKTLLKEMQRRSKVGGIVDRRFGENDPSMTPEERALQRFIKERERGGKGSLFDLEDDSGDFGGLTHLGRSLADDFDEPEVSEFEDGDVDNEGMLRAKKRRRLSNEGDGDRANIIEEEESSAPQRPKTKREVMQEVIAKSKLHKFERQKAKEDDDQLRAELDMELKDIYALLQRGKVSVKPTLQGLKPAEPHINPDRAALLEGKSRDDADKEYDKRLRQLALDARSKPSARTKTEEEIATERADRLHELEQQRMRRMLGEEAEESEQPTEMDGNDDFEEDGEAAEAAVTGLGAGIPAQPHRQPLGVEDEDDFILDDDLIASDSEAEAVLEDESDSGQDSHEEDEEKEFVAELLTEAEASRDELSSMDNVKTNKINGTSSSRSFSYPCPQSHEELVKFIKEEQINHNELFTLVQKIRAFYDPKLKEENKELLGIFSTTLVDHISYMVNQPARPEFKAVEGLIRHIHSLAKTFPSEVGSAFREHLCDMQKRPTSLEPGDLIIMTAIGSIFPTSDHFHQVVTPAILTMARFLGQKIPQSLADIAKSLYVCTLCVNYQRLSKRYLPEVVNALHFALATLAPTQPESYGEYPSHESSESMRIGFEGTMSTAECRRLKFWDIEHNVDEDDHVLKLSLLNTALTLVETLSELWEGKTAYPEVFRPFVCAVEQYSSGDGSERIPRSEIDHLKRVQALLQERVNDALKNRKFLELHHHRPLAIKTAIPKFEEDFNPNKHYDPDRERAELRKLQKEHKKERKGALRELRKDASFIAREQLREKKERDEAYEKKQRRLIAEINAEEGREKNEYEREKRLRKKNR